MKEEVLLKVPSDFISQKSIFVINSSFWINLFFDNCLASYCPAFFKFDLILLLSCQLSFLHFNRS